MTPDPQEIEQLKSTGQVSSYEQLDKLVDDFERVLKNHGVVIRRDSELEKACLAVTEVLGKHKNPKLREPMTDIRPLLTKVLGFWLFLTKIVRLENHTNFKQFEPHLEYLNKGTVVQNTQIGTSEEATNKIFELLFALCMLDVGTEVVLDPPEGAKGDNPDIMVTLEGKRWGFACKTIYGKSGKAIFDNLKKGVDQIERSPVDVGCVLLNFRNFLDPQVYWPLLNEEAFKAKREEPAYAAFTNPMESIAPRIQKVIREKRCAVLSEIIEFCITD